MKNFICFLLLILSPHLVTAQKTCRELKKDIADYESLIKSYDRDTMAFLKETAQYSNKTDKESIEKYNSAKSFLATIARDKATAIATKEGFEKELKNCKE